MRYQNGKLKRERERKRRRNRDKDRTAVETAAREESARGAENGAFYDGFRESRCARVWPEIDDGAYVNGV